MPQRIKYAGRPSAARNQKTMGRNPAKPKQFRALKKQSTGVVLMDRATLADEVVDRLRADIVSGALKPSERLRFENLTSRYGVSVSPLREALSRLTAEELVQP